MITSYIKFSRIVFQHVHFAGHGWFPINNIQVAPVVRNDARLLMQYPAANDASSD